MFPRLTQRLRTAAQSPHAQGVLALVAFLESSIFPLPAEAVMVPMCLTKPEKSLRYAAIASVASVLGGIFGWMIGHFLFDLIAAPLLTFWHSMPVHAMRPRQWCNGLVSDKPCSIFDAYICCFFDGIGTADCCP
jgi:membrane protein YqaA with SNARE-associated domain